MQTKTRTYKVNELAEAAGVSVRTVRYYVQRGLLPTPPFRGPDTVYDEEHLLRLKAIRALQQRHAPLDEIFVALERADEAGLRALAEERPLPGADHAASAEHDRRPEVRSVAWMRIELGPGIELHVRDDVGGMDAAWVQQVADFAVRTRRGAGGERG